MARYATGKKSKAISDISGFKVNYTDLKTTYDNLRVEPSDFDPKHPQLTPAKNVIDATALFQPRPDNDPENVSFVVGFNTHIFASKIENEQKIANKRKSMIGSGDRSEKIRSYNYPQGRVTDHRINLTLYDLQNIVSGDIDKLVEELKIVQDSELIKNEDL